MICRWNYRIITRRCYIIANCQSTCYIGRVEQCVADSNLCCIRIDSCLVHAICDGLRYKNFNAEYCLAVNCILRINACHVSRCYGRVFLIVEECAHARICAAVGAVAVFQTEFFQRYPLTACILDFQCYGKAVCTRVICNKCFDICITIAVCCCLVHCPCVTCRCNYRIITRIIGRIIGRRCYIIADYQRTCYISRIEQSVADSNLCCIRIDSCLIHAVCNWSRNLQLNAKYCLIFNCILRVNAGHVCRSYGRVFLIVEECAHARIRAAVGAVAVYQTEVLQGYPLAACVLNFHTNCETVCAGVVCYECFNVNITIVVHHCIVQRPCKIACLCLFCVRHSSCQCRCRQSTCDHGCTHAKRSQRWQKLFHLHRAMFPF